MLTAILCALAILAYAAAGPAPSALVFERAAVIGGQWWRLLTAHLVHADFAHLGWDVAALAVAGAMVERCSRTQLAAALVAAIAAV
ncbi:MAG: rhomboid family intramembrane serine protease, partial [Candidatus Dadabacteria bacterium]